MSFAGAAVLFGSRDAGFPTVVPTESPFSVSERSVLLSWSVVVVFFIGIGCLGATRASFFVVAVPSCYLSARGSRSVDLVESREGGFTERHRLFGTIIAAAVVSGTGN